MILKLKIYFLIWIYKIKYNKYIFLPTSLVYAQSVLETGNFTSDVFKENNNLFGMRENSRDYDTGTNRYHATYDNINDSIKDYFARQNQFNITYKGITDYIYQTYNSNYAEAKNYKEVWFKVFQNYEKFSKITLFFVPSIIVIYLYYSKKLPFL